MNKTRKNFTHKKNRKIEENVNRSEEEGKKKKRGTSFMHLYNDTYIFIFLFAQFKQLDHL